MSRKRARREYEKVNKQAEKEERVLEECMAEAKNQHLFLIGITSPTSSARKTCSKPISP